MRLLHFKKAFLELLPEVLKRLRSGELKYLHASPEPARGKLAMLPTSSQLGKCRRLVSYQKLGYEGMEPALEDELWLRMMFDSHDLLQLVLAEMCKEYGWTYWLEKRQNVADLTSSCPDFVIENKKEDLVIEVKNCSKRAFDAIKDGDLESLFERYPYYYHQFQCNLHAVPKAKKGFLILRFVPHYKARGTHFKFFEIKKDAKWVSDWLKPWTDGLLDSLGNKSYLSLSMRKRARAAHVVIAHIIIYVRERKRSKYMPYIDRESRQALLPKVKVLANDIIGVGELNYCITMLCHLFSRKYGRPAYKDYNEIIGVLECAKQEYYRAVVGAYEDQKMSENGGLDEKQ